MHVDPDPLSWGATAGAWQLEPSSAVVIAAVAVAYTYYRRRGGDGDNSVPVGRIWCFGIGLAIWVVATMGVVGVYAPVLFWMRALQVLLLLYVAPLFIAQGKPVTVVRDALGVAGRDRLDRLLDSGPARVVAHPLTTSLAMLGTPWLLYLTPWYTASLQTVWVGALTRFLLVAIGFLYFYTRLQADPVPRRYSQLISLLISVGEALGDGVLGLVVWQGPLIAGAYYVGLHRSWGPGPRLDQTIGAGVLWILGDVIGLPFVLLLMRALGRDEKALAAQVDAELDTAEAVAQADEGAARAAPSGLWWENDPQLRGRFGR